MTCTYCKHLTIDAVLSHCQFSKAAHGHTRIVPLKHRLVRIEGFVPVRLHAQFSFQEMVAMDKTECGQSEMRTVLYVKTGKFEYDIVLQ